MLNENEQERATKYICKKCDYTTSRANNLNRHILSSKHKRRTNTNKNEQERAEKIFLCSCGKKYKHQSSLCKHKKKCDFQESNIVEENSELIVSSETGHLKDLVKSLIDENKELTKTIRDMAPKIGNNNNTNNQFNLNIFLNEKCKDALNLSDFVQTLQVEFTDLENTVNNGTIQGLSNIIVKGLRELDTYKRPIHCTDMKRETLYIKDNNEWEKEKDNKKLNSVINHVASEQMKLIKEWEERNPNWIDNEYKQQEYLNLVNSIMGFKPEDQTDSNKIIKNIAKEVTIDK